MKTFAFAVLGLLALLVAAAVIAPFVVDLNDYKGVAADLVRENTGRNLVIEGDVDLSLLPVPTVRVANVRFANLDGAAAPDMVRVSAVGVSIALMPLFRGEVEVGSLTFVDPVIELERLADGRANWELATAGGSGQPGDSGRPVVSIDSLVVENATLVYRDSAAGIVERIEGLYIDAAVGSIDGPFQAEGRMVAGSLPVAFEAKVGRLDRHPIPLRLALALTSVDASLAFTGSASSASATAELTGKLKAEGASLARLLAAAGGQSNTLLAHAFSVTAGVTASAAALGVNDIAFDLGGMQGTGAVSAALANGPQIDVALALNQIDLDKLAAAAAAAPPTGAPVVGPARPFTLPGGVYATLDLRVNALVFNQAVVRQAQVVAALDQGVLTLQQASALLPGGSDITVFGVLDGLDGKPHFTGQVEASADNLRAVLDWLAVTLPEIPADRLRKLSLSTMVEVTPSLAKVSAIDLRVDHSRLTGGVNIGIGARPAFNAIVAIDGINLDGYLPPPAEPGAAAEGAEGDALAFLGAFDAEIKAQVGNLVYNAVPVSGVALDAGVRSGVLTLRSLRIGDVAGAGVILGGTVDSAGPAFDIDYNIEAADAARLFQLAGVAPPAGNLGGMVARGRVRGDLSAVMLDTTVALSDAEARFTGALEGLAGTPAVDAAISLQAASLARLARRFGAALPAIADTPFMVEGEIKGDVAAATVALAVSALGAEVRVDGGVANLLYAPAYELVLDARHPEFVTLVESLADGVSFARRDLGEVRVSAKIFGDAAEARVSDLDATLGPTRLSGAVTVRFDGPRPRFDADLAAGELVADLFLAAAGGSGAETATAAGAGGGGAATERWSRAPIDLSGLRAVDGTARISAKALVFRKYRFEAVTLRLALNDGALDIEEFTGRLYGAPARLRARLVATAPPSAELSIDLEGADMRALLVDSVGVDAVSGRLDLSGRFETRGRSELELVSALDGRATVAARDGAVEGIDLGRLNARLGNIDSEADLAGLVGAALTGGTTPIHSLEGIFLASGGVIRTDDLHAVLEGGEGRATATIDLPRWQLALNSELRLSGHPNAPPVGVLLMGPIDNPAREIRDEALRAHVMEKVIGAVVRKLAPAVTGESGAGGAVGDLLGTILGGGVAQPQSDEAPAEEEQPPPEPEPQQLFENLLEGLIQGVGN